MKKRFTRRNLETALIIGGALTGSVLLNLHTLNTERARREVQLVIDKGSNRIITHEEWVPVYQELGIEYRRQMGLDLSTKQLRQYLQNHRGSQ